MKIIVIIKIEKMTLSKMTSKYALLFKFVLYLFYNSDKIMIDERVSLRFVSATYNDN